MTTINDVGFELSKFIGQHHLAKEWLNNDIIKMKIVMSYEAWIIDHIDQPEMQIPLEGHVEYCLIHPELLGA